jgi:hypothetical protein
VAKCSTSSGGPSIVKSTPTIPIRMASQPRSSSLVRSSQVPWPAGVTSPNPRGIRLRTSSAGAW